MAADLINFASEKTLSDILYFFGEERASRRIAKAIVARREKELFVTTTDLAKLIETVLPRSKPGQSHPATRSFQAIRIAVNKEYKELFEKGIIKENVNQKLFIPNILTLSEYEQELSKIYKIKINNFQNVGSLRLYNFYHYKKFIKKQKIEFSKLPTYDLAILSDYNGWDQRLGIDYTKKILETLNTIIEIVIKNKLNCVFLYKATKKNLIKREKEHSLYKNGLYKNNFDFISNKIIERNSRFGTYEILLKTNLLIGTISTLLRENIALGGKSLACNQTPKNIYDFPIKGICNIKNFNPEELEQRILYLLQISRKNYSKTLGSNKDYVCNTNYEKTKKLILQNLNI
jgi:hypothetical protein